MKFVFRLFLIATRNLFRNWRRTLITMISIIFGVAAIILSYGLIEGIEESSIRTAIDVQYGTVRLFKKGYNNTEEILLLDPVIENPESIQKKIENGPFNARTSARITFEGELTGGYDSIRVIALGVEPESYGRLFKVKEKLIAGSYFSGESDATAEILISETLNDVLGLNIGDTVTLVARARGVPGVEDSKGAISAFDFTLRGIFRTGAPALDYNHVIIPLSGAQEMLMMKDMVTEISIHAERSKTQELVSWLLENFSGYECRDWRKETEDIQRINELRRRAFALAIAVIFLISAFGIANTMLMATYERVREIGMLGALGMTSTEIMSLFLLEGFMTGLAGALSGIILGASLNYYYSLHGIVFRLDDMGQMNVPVSDTIYTVFRPDMLFVAAFIALAVSTVASFLPARRSAIKQPVELLRE